MSTIPIGARGSFALDVSGEHLANRFKDLTLPPVFSTPMLVLIMENAALNAIKPYLEPGTTALGTRVDIQHLAATPAGRRVVGEAEVTAIDGRTITFSVTARDGDELIGRGEHQRRIIDLARFTERLKSKFA